MKETLTRYISQELLSGRKPGGISEDEELLLSGLLDSLGIMQLVAFIEDELALGVPPEDVTIENFRSVRKIHDYLERRGIPE